MNRYPNLHACKHSAALVRQPSASTMTGRLLSIGLLALGLVAVASWQAISAEVAVETHGKTFKIHAAKYEMTITADGGVASLSVGGEAMLPAPGRLPQGAYFYQDHVLKLPEISKSAGNALVAKSEKAAIAYQFAPDGMTWKLTNLTAKAMEFVILFGADVQAVRDEDGNYWKPVVAQDWSATIWFRGRASLSVEGGSRLWGPFAKDLQVWTATVAPRQTHAIVFRAGVATAEEMAKVAAAKPYIAPVPPEPVGPMWDTKALDKAPAYVPADGFHDEGVQAIFYDGLPWKKKPTRVFAWLGLPKTTTAKKVPGIVLVHGGGGTAFSEWVRLWNSRGYAAIAMDTCGGVPRGTYGHWDRDASGGPPGWGGWNQIDRPHEDQWTYHAVADVVLAHSLLRSLATVDPQRIGLTGISWGGYLTSLVAGVDQRFKFAAPVYGCGFTNEHGFARSVTSLGKERGDRWMRWWDPSAYLGHAGMPMLWVSGSNDFAYTFNALQKSYRLPQGPHTLAIRLRMPHGQRPGENPPEIRVFADSICKQGEPLVQIVQQGCEGNKVWAAYHSSHPIVKAELNSTSDSGKWQDRHWIATPAAIDAGGHRVTATLPAATKVYYLNLFDDRDCVVSTEHVER